MTNMDDQIARHVRDMILRITQKDAQGRQQPNKARAPSIEPPGSSVLRGLEKPSDTQV